MKRTFFAVACGFALGVQGSFAGSHWHYAFDGNCADAGTNAQHGTGSSGVVFQDGHKGQCAKFSGSEFVSLPLDLNGTADLSFSFWLKLEGSQPGPYYAMVLSSDANTFGRGFAVNLWDGDYQVWLDDQSVNTGLPVPGIGEWQHVCLTYTPGSAKLYLDGQEAYEFQGYTNAPPYNDSTNLLVGLRNLFFDRGMNASIDELHIFDRTLGPEEVGQLAYDDQSLLAYYKFEDSVADSSPNAFDGIPSTNLTYENSIHGRGLVLPPKPYVRLPIDLNPYGSISFSFWMKMNGSLQNPDYGMFFSTDNNTFGRGLGVNAGNNRFMVWHDDNFEYLNITVPPVGVWKHVGMTYEPGQACFYIDGQRVHTNTQHTNQPPYNDAANITLGIRNLFLDRGADFSIDELRIYNRSLSSNEMLSIFGMGLTVTGIVVEGSSAIGPQRTTAFSCYAGLANGQRMEVTPAAQFHIEPAEASNDVWFVGNVLHCGTPAAEATVQVFATYEHVSGVATSAAHEIRIKTDGSDCLLAHYPLDGNAFDASGNALDGAISGATVSTDAVVGACFRFNGRNTVSLPVDLNDCGEMSYSLWFKIMGTQPGPYYAMLLSSDNNTYGRGVAITLTNSNFQLWFDNGWEDTGTHTPTAGEWHHLAATYRPGENIFYFDGVEVYRDTARIAAAPYNDATNLLLGMRNRFFDRGFNGLIDEVKIFRCTLSANAVWDDYASLAGDKVNRMPVIQVMPDLTNGVAPCKITFDFTESYDPDGWIVRSEVDQEGDGVFEQSVEGAGRLSVDYLRPGNCQTFLRVVDNFGAAATASVHVVVDGAAPEVVLLAEPASGPAPLDVAFDAHVTLASSNLAVSIYEWDFDGDGATDEISTVPQIQHVYGETGEYAVCVFATDTAGVMGHGERTVTVLPPMVPPACNPALEIFPPTGFSPLAAELRVLNVSNCVYSEIEWDFEGDGLVDATSPAFSITNLYARPGKYWPTAKVLFADGSQAVLSNLLQISESSDLRVWISQPREGQVVWGDAIALHANTAPGNLTGGVRFQYRLADAAEWTDIGTWMEPPPHSFVQEWDASALPSGSAVFLRAMARDVQDRQICSDSVQVQVAEPMAGDSHGVAAIGNQLHYNVEASRRCEYQMADGFEFSIPPFTTPSNQVLSIESGAAPLARSLSGFSGKTLLSGVYSLDLGAGVFGQAIELLIPYADADGDGLVDGTSIHESTLNAYGYDEASQTWQKTIRSDVDSVNNRVRTLVAKSCDIRLAGNPSLLLPPHGCVLLSASGDSSAAPRNLNDGNNSSCWRADASQLPMEVVFGFTNRNIAIISGISLLNAGGASNEPLQSFQIATSLDGTNFTPYASGVLASSEDLQNFGVTSVTCRFVKLVLVDGYAATGATLNEIYALGSLTADSDQDGVGDVWELRYFNSLSNDGWADPDGDGVGNGLEEQLGFDPTKADTDDDGYPDRSEYIAGTSGVDGEDLLALALDGQAMGASNLVFRWRSATGRVYSVMCGTNLLAPWPGIPAYVVTGDGTEKSFTNDRPMDAEVFFRLKVDLE